MIIEDSDLEVIKNPKVFFLILMFTYQSKDEMYYFLVRLNKRNGIKYVQKYFHVIDSFLPIPHAQTHGVDFKLLGTID